MDNIASFAACFFGTSPDILEKQSSIVDSLESEYGYHIERWFRKERNPGYYSSFSQMVNDAIDDTESEFMIFFNPKTKITKEMFLETIERLESGYCFVSLVAFGFFGFSKELIRCIGMFDESFLFGEFEDDDFSLRLGHFGKAVWFEYRKNSYDIQEISKIKDPNIMKGISGSVFREKYKMGDSGNFIVSENDLLKVKRISKRHSKPNLDIRDSWLDSSMSHHDGTRHGEYASKNLIRLSREEDLVIRGKSEIYIKIDLQNNPDGISDFKITYNSNGNKDIFFKITKPYYLGGDYIYSAGLKPNHWISARTSPHGNESLPMYNGDVEIRIFWAGSQIYHSVLEFGREHNLSFNL